MVRTGFWTSQVSWQFSHNQFLVQSEIKCPQSPPHLFCSLTRLLTCALARRGGHHTLHHHHFFAPARPMVQYRVFYETKRCGTSSMSMTRTRLLLRC
jgi:hypothetical protein